MKLVHLAFCLSLYSLTSSAFTDAQKEMIGHRIFMNECSGKKELLVFWNPHEPFPSLGIAHCIWFPPGYIGRYTQTFPDLARFLKQKGVALPERLLNSYCPWKTREEFVADPQTRTILTNLLFQTIELQTEFLLERFKKSKKHILKKSHGATRAHIRNMFSVLEATTQGTFALLDYLNFKGEGTNRDERYKDTGWGLMQVLSTMPHDTSECNAVSHFITAAKKVLDARVKNAPQGSSDMRPLKGWHARIDRYAHIE